MQVRLDPDLVPEHLGFVKYSNAVLHISGITVTMSPLNQYRMCAYTLLGCQAVVSPLVCQLQLIVYVWYTDVCKQTSI